jgi:parallel beta-helix repeat protein
MEQRDPSPPAKGRGSAWYRGRRAFIAAGAIVLAGVLAVVTYVVTADGQPVAETPTSVSTTPTAATVKAPAAPPAKICGNANALAGPAKPPAGAVTVSTTQSLEDLTAKSPAGTTFWLTPGTHKLGGGEYVQVIPKQGNTYLGAPGAILDGAHSNRYAFTGYAIGVTIKGLTIQNFGRPRGTNDEGVVNHNASANWTIEASTIRDNSGAGLMVGTKNVVRGNCLQRNGQYGFSAYNPGKVSGITIERNEIAGNNTDNWEVLKPGCGCTGGGKFWAVAGAVVRGNWIHDNDGPGMWADTNNTGFAIEGNYISGNFAEGIVYETSYNASIRGNTFVRNGLGKGPKNQGFPTPAVYVSESGSDPRVAGMYGRTFEISNNAFTDNWAGVILWENADRFAGSPANTSSGSGTLVNPSVATIETCNADTIKNPPYFGDCRWKTQNVQVHDNVFSFDPTKIGKTCATRSGCGFNGVFANWGTYPDWSAYKERTVQDAITFKQNNKFFDNTYRGPWNFIVHEQGSSVNWPSWQGAPYDQDRDSVIKVQGR